MKHYYLILKEETSNYISSKEKIVRYGTRNENIVNGDFSKAFPAEYIKNKYIEIMSDTKLPPFKINSDFSLYFYSDKEQALLNYRSLRDGEYIEDGKLNFVKSPGTDTDYVWHDKNWMTNREFEIETGVITLESEIERLIKEIADHKIYLRENVPLEFEFKGKTVKQKYRKSDTADITSRILQTREDNKTKLWVFTEGGMFNLNEEEYIELGNILANAVDELYATEYILVNTVSNLDLEALGNFDVKIEWKKLTK